MTTLKEVSVETGIKESDLIVSTTKVGNLKFSVICPECGRRRFAFMAFLTSCPGPYNAVSAKSVEGCGNTYFLRSDLKEKKGGENMGFLKKKSPSIVAPTVAAAIASKAPEKKTIKSQILDAHKNGADYETIAKQVERSRAYVVSTISKSNKK